MTDKRTLPGPAMAPFRKGNLQEYPGYGFRSGDVTDGDCLWRPNDPFTATLTLTGTERGRSAMRFLWEDEATGATYPMFATDMAGLAMSSEGVANGRAAGQWIVMKRGANYGIARYTA